MQKILADGKAEVEFLQGLRRRSAETDAQVTKAVAEIIQQVRLNGDQALMEYTE